MLQPSLLVAFITASTTCALLLVLYSANDTASQDLANQIVQRPAAITTISGPKPVRSFDFRTADAHIGALWEQNTDSASQAGRPSTWSGLKPSSKKHQQRPSSKRNDANIPITDSSVEGRQQDNWRVATAQDIPFPLYPNGTRYRIGGKNGVKIALFETTDDFNTVDAYYGKRARSSGLSRKMMMLDYVQYRQIDHATDAEVIPGIVIHKFFNANEAEKLGAAANSRTNIIISFR